MKLAKKAAGLVVTAVMTISLAVASVPQVAFAADNWEKPSTDAWTTDLSIFNLKSSSESDHHYKKLQFGKYDENAINWYIAGADKNHADLLAYSLQGADGEEAVQKPFGSMAFYSNETELGHDYPGGNYYIDRSAPRMVYANHYGSSDIRNFLTGELLNNFTEKEQELMNETTLTVADYCNSDNEGHYPSHYTVTDKLYLATDPADDSDGSIIYLGANGSVEVPLSADTSHPYGKNEANFWLAAPHHDRHFSALIARPGDGGVGMCNVGNYSSFGICPAFNLKLTSDLFFSAATTAVPIDDREGGELTANGLPLILRQEDTEGTTNLASASVKYDTDKITVKGGEDSATLVVQWKVGTQDYYYKQAIEAGADAEVTVSDIVSVSESPAGALTADCAVWLEYTDNTSHITYAKKGEFETSTTDITDATIEVAESPVYTGTPVDPDDFGITVTLDGFMEPLPETAYDLHFYTTEDCTVEVVNTDDNPCAPTDAGVYYVKAVGVEAKNYSGTVGPAQVKVLKAKLPKPVAATLLIYDGTEKTGVSLPDGADASKYNISGDKATEVGKYTANIALADDDNYCWSGESGNPEDPEISQPFTIDWEIKPAAAETHIVTFIVDDEEYEKQEVEEGGFATKPADPVKPGAKFAGWFLSKAGEGSAFDFEKTPIMADTTLYANWTAVPSPEEYKVIIGAGQTVVVNAESALFTSNADFSKFVRVEVDGQTVAKKYYTAKSGSTVITFSKEYISTLKAGEHTLEIVSSDGSAKTKFTIVETPPETGDQNAFVLWCVLLLAAGGAFAGMMVYKRRVEE